VSGEAVTKTVPWLLSWVNTVNHLLAESNRHRTCEQKNIFLFFVFNFPELNCFAL